LLVARIVHFGEDAADGALKIRPHTRRQAPMREEDVVSSESHLDIVST